MDDMVECQAGKVKYLFIGDEAARPSRLSRAMLALCYVRRVSGGSRLLDRSHATNTHAGPGKPPENRTFETESGGELPRTTKNGREMV
jgi:hypothetical protein